MPTKQGIIRLKFDTTANEWAMKVGSGGFQLPPYPTLVVGKNQVGLFTFQIEPETNATFATTPFTQKGGIPQKADFSDQFIVIPQGSKTLVVVDTNEHKGGGNYPGGSYEYQLNFVGMKPLDPIITNNGCCQLFSTGELIAYGLAFAALCALAVVGFRNWRARQATTPGGTGTSGSSSSTSDPKDPTGPR